MNFQTVFGLILCGIQAALLLPLLTHARRHRSALGVSLPGEAAWAAAGLGWMAYGLLAQTPVLILSGALATAGSAGLCLLLRRDDSVPLRTWNISVLTGVGLLLALGAATMLWGLAGLSVVLAVFGVVQFLPQAITIITRWNKPNPGVSVKAAALRGIYTLSWAGYAAGWAVFSTADADWPLITWGVSGAVVFTVQAASTWHHRRRSTALQHPHEPEEAMSS